MGKNVRSNDEILSYDSKVVDNGMAEASGVGQEQEN
jgi:hypothetical protein